MSAPELRTKYMRVRFEIQDPKKPSFARQEELVRRALRKMKEAVGTMELDGAKLWIEDFGD